MSLCPPVRTIILIFLRLGVMAASVPSHPLEVPSGPLIIVTGRYFLAFDHTSWGDKILGSVTEQCIGIKSHIAWGNSEKLP